MPAHDPRIDISKRRVREQIILLPVYSRSAHWSLGVRPMASREKPWSQQALAARTLRVRP